MMLDTDPQLQKVIYRGQLIGYFRIWENSKETILPDRATTVSGQHLWWLIQTWRESGGSLSIEPGDHVSTVDNVCFGFVIGKGSIAGIPGYLIDCITRKDFIPEAYIKLRWTKEEMEWNSDRSVLQPNPEVL